MTTQTTRLALTHRKTGEIFDTFASREEYEAWCGRKRRGGGFAPDEKEWELKEVTR